MFTLTEPIFVCDPQRVFVLSCFIRQRGSIINPVKNLADVFFITCDVDVESVMMWDVY